MRNKTGKLFQNIQSREVAVFEYATNYEYYAFVEKIQKQGYNQCIVTSDIMLKFMEYFIYEYNANITAIEFMIDDDVLQEEINALLSRMKTQPVFWDKLKQKILFLCEDNCIDIRKVDFKCSEKGFLLSIMVNGMFTVTDTSYEIIAEKLSKQMEVLIK